MNEEQVVKLMKSSKSLQEWGDNCDKVREACGGYPDFWFGAIVLSGVATATAVNWGGSSEIEVITIN